MRWPIRLMIIIWLNAMANCGPMPIIVGMITSSAIAHSQVLNESAGR